MNIYFFTETENRSMLQLSIEAQESLAKSEMQKKVLQNKAKFPKIKIEIKKQNKNFEKEKLNPKNKNFENQKLKYRKQKKKNKK